VPAPGARYSWPLHPTPEVLSQFRAPDHRFGPGHRGADLAGQVGQPVVAARAGVVLFTGPVGGRGVVSVLHDDGLRTTYEPVHPVVRAGSPIAAGGVLGTLLACHRGCPQACLHWGVRRDRLEYVDPLVLVRPTRLRLLPVPVR
jgi:murein DD-endopeptidase MepM/ murein hydrolase activator NlpD